MEAGAVMERAGGQAGTAQERAAFIVIVDHSAGHEPVIGDVLWALLNSRTFNAESNPDWRVHVTNLTPEMLAHHKLVDDDTARVPQRWVDEMVIALEAANTIGEWHHVGLNYANHDRLLAEAAQYTPYATTVYNHPPEATTP